MLISYRYNLACHRLETLLQNIDLPPLNSANNAQYFLRKPDKAVEEDSRVFSAYQDCIQLQLQLNLAHHAVQRLRVSLEPPGNTCPRATTPESWSRTLLRNSSELSSDTYWTHCSACCTAAMVREAAVPNSTSLKKKWTLHLS